MMAKTTFTPRKKNDNELEANIKGVRKNCDLNNNRTNQIRNGELQQHLVTSNLR